MALQGQWIRRRQFGETRMSVRSIPNMVTLHRYYIAASLCRELFWANLPNIRIPDAIPIHPNALAAMQLWYASLVTLIDGWRHERMRDDAVTALLRDRKRVELLRDARHSIFHYDPEYISDRFLTLIQEPGVAEWANNLTDAIGAALLARMSAIVDRGGAGSS